VPNWGQSIGEDWNVSSVNTSHVPIKKIFEKHILKKFKVPLKNKGKILTINIWRSMS
jgi:hypothetical protein